MFQRISANVLVGARALEEMLQKLPHENGSAKKVLDIEHEGDILTHEIIEAINATFITPFDREDIHNLAARLDDILDFVEGAADRCILYQVKPTVPFALKLAHVIVESAEQIDLLMKDLRELKNQRLIFDRFIEVNRLENEGDKILREAIKYLFARETNALEVIKWKEIYELLEAATDRCEDVANIVEQVVVKYA